MLIREWVKRKDGDGWTYLHEPCHGCGFFWHYHPEFELTLMRGGRGMRYIGSDAEAFGPLDLALVAPNAPHTWHSPEAGPEQRVQVIFFTLEWLQAMGAHGAPELRRLAHWLESIRSGVIFSPSLAERLAPLFTRFDQAEGLARLGVLMEILDALPHDAGMRLLQASAPSVSDRRLTAALEHLQQHFTSGVTLEDVARAANASPATIKRLFSTQMQTTFSELLAQLRIGHASDLLVRGDMPIPAIAEASGFPSLSQFYRKFVAMKGCTPAQHRKHGGQTQQRGV